MEGRVQVHDLKSGLAGKVMEGKVRLHAYMNTVQVIGSMMQTQGTVKLHACTNTALVWKATCCRASTHVAEQTPVLNSKMTSTLTR